MSDPNNKPDASAEPIAGKTQGGQESRSSGQPTDGESPPKPKAPGHQGGARPTQAPAAEAATDAITLLMADHRRVEALFADYEQAGDDRKDELIEKICAELVVHTLVEEELFYPACRQAIADEDSLDDAQVEHDSAKLLIGDLMRRDDDDPYRDAKVRVLSEQIKHHVGEEEAPEDGIFVKAQAAGVNTPELGQRLQARRRQLQAQARETPWPQPVSIRWRPQVPDGPQQEESMARQQDDNGRDRGRSTRDDDERRNGSRSSSRGRGDDDRRESSQSRSRGRDDDDRPGWYGDSEGHAEAARRGWEERRGETRSFARSRDDDDRGGRSQDREDDDRGYRSRGRDDDRPGWRGDPEGHSEASRRGWETRREEGRDRYRDDDRPGWFGDPEGHSRAAREGWEERREEGRDRYRDDDRPGWFGDPEGHSEAARRGWEERRGESRSRSRDDDDDRRGGSRGRGRDDDDDRGRRSGGRAQGGWFGDSRGHSEAARRGQEERR